jgi:hypothetical protein
MAKKPEKAGLISSEKLCALCGLTDRRTRQLADQGYFPPPIRGQYQTSATISGLFRYYRDFSQRHHAAKEAIVNEKVRKDKRENEEAEGLLVLKSEVLESLAKSLIALKEHLRHKLEVDCPRDFSGMSVPESRILGKRLFDELCQKYFETLAKWTI